eukprot:GHVL01015773.1.p1 GENE.GHVL01015773.1~~GHVL01015773.1.p1  ORF type:complete len:1435 (-),score=233.56 GHVL01015773.1:129-3935(-)
MDNVLMDTFVFDDEDAITVHVLLEGLSPSFYLHWGFSEVGKPWTAPPKQVIEATEDRCIPKDLKAVETRFRAADGMPDVFRVKLRIPVEFIPPQLSFVIRTENNTWIHNSSTTKDFVIQFNKIDAYNSKWKTARDRVDSMLAEEKKIAESENKKKIQNFRHYRDKRQEEADITFRTVSFGEDFGEADVWAVSKEDYIEVHLSFCLNLPTIVHWGVLPEPRSVNWVCPSEEIRPPNTVVADSRKAVQTTLDSSQSLMIKVPVIDGRPKLAGIIFVLKENGGLERWIRESGNRDTVVRIMQTPGGSWKGDHQDMVSRIIDAEVYSDHWTLMHRDNLCRQFIEEFAPAEEKRVDSENDFWGWLYVWLRYSSMRVLDWQRNYNTKPKDLSHASEMLSKSLTYAWMKCQQSRPLIKLVLSTVTSAGGDGQKIRDEILQIMHRQGIKEISGHFYEQWHQKLHNNTTPDDVVICKALLRFLRSNGDENQFYKALEEHGLSKERLASYDRPITQRPVLHGDNGALIWEFENYLKVLQSVHDCTDLRVAINRAEHHVPHEIKGNLHEILSFGQESGLSARRQLGLQLAKSRSFEDVKDHDHSYNAQARHQLNRLAYCRRVLLKHIVGMECKEDNIRVVRELLFLDLALEQQQMLINQRNRGETDILNLTENLINLIESMSLNNPADEELKALLSDWTSLGKISAELRWNNSSELSAYLLKALSERLNMYVGNAVDIYQNLLVDKAAFLGQQVGARQELIDGFVEDTLRSSILFSVSLLLKLLDTRIRDLAKLPPWEIISQVDKVVGRVEIITKMIHIQHNVYSVPTILITEFVSGEEEIPEAVVGVIVRNPHQSPDILSHVAVRCRNAHILLVVCTQPELVDNMVSEYENKFCEVNALSNGLVTFASAQEISSKKKKRLDETVESSETEINQNKDISRMDLETESSEWCLPSDKFDEANVGAKSLNLKKIQNMLNGEEKIPQAVALPRGCFQRCLNSEENYCGAKLRLIEAVNHLEPEITNERAESIFTTIRFIVENLVAPEQLMDCLKECMKCKSSYPGEDLRLLSLFTEDEAWDAIGRVWSSMFSLKPWISLKKAGRVYADLNMAVLVQELIPADYAFVIHTKSPFGDPTQLYGELVVGLGETLVSSSPGRSMAFRARRGEEPTIVAFPSKSTALKGAASLIFRSDSNSEDLEGFSGAGIFESVTAVPASEIRVRYHLDPIITNADLRNNIMKRIAEVSWRIEDIIGSPQDIEGCITRNNDKVQLFVVQTRPQMI